MRRDHQLAALACALTLTLATAAAPGTQAQERTQSAALPALPSACRNPLLPPAAEPPAGSAPVVAGLELCVEPREQNVEPYLPAVRTVAHVSQPSRGRWQAFTPTVTETLDADVARLRQMTGLEDVRAEVNDYVFPNGVIGKVITLHLRRR